MGLRDAIDAGMAEIRTTAEGIIASLKIAEKIKQATFSGETFIDVSFKKGRNLYIIQEEVVRQIVEEGFEVEHVYPCCANPNHDIYEDDYIQCSGCGSVFFRSSDDIMDYVRMTISWDSKIE